MGYYYNYYNIKDAKTHLEMSDFKEKQNNNDKQHFKFNKFKVFYLLAPRTPVREHMQQQVIIS